MPLFLHICKKKCTFARCMKKICVFIIAVWCGWGAVQADRYAKVSMLTENNLIRQANISVLVQDLGTGEVIDSFRANQVVPPASVMKLLTTGAALEILGPSFRFPTELCYSGEVKDGVLHGDLIIRGSCDPSLGNRKGTNAFLGRWVKAVQQSGIRRIEGAVIADMSMLDGDAVNPAWLWEDAGNYYAPGIFGINYLSNTLNILLRSGAIGSVAEVIRTEPDYPGLKYNNHIRCTQTAYDGAFVHGLPYSTERYLTGSIPFNHGQFGVQSDIPNPGWLLARHLSEQLERAGVAVAQEARFAGDKGPVLRDGRTIHTHLSDSLGVLIAEANQYSSNLYAEALFRYLGTQYGIPGTVHNSCELLRDFWRRHGVDVRGALIKDGCGLAPQDAVSAASLVQLLSYMDKSRYRDVWNASLPVSGVSGTLKGFLAKTALQGRVHAKSGTIGGTKNFAGYIDFPDGRRWAFAVLVNSAPCKARQIQPIIEKYLLEIYQQGLQ